MDLDKDEKIVLGEGKLTDGFKLVLTNKRLIVMRKKGLLSSRYVEDEIIPLAQVSEAYSTISGAWVVEATLKLKNGTERSFKGFVDPGSVLEVAMGTFDTMLMREKAVADRWVNAINNQITH